MARKYLITIIVCILTAVLTACETKETPKVSESEVRTSESTENQTDTETTAAAFSLDSMVSSAILSSNLAWYPASECTGEGHIILDTMENGSMLTVYALSIYGGYSFEDGNFVKSCGTGVIPVSIDFTVTESGEYELANYHVPLDGSLYEGSIRQMFPASLQERCLSPKDEDKKELERQERLYAETYLKSIGRDAKIGEYGDFEHPLLTDRGVSVDVSNSITGKNILEHYPFWIGNTERLEDGLRYVYQMDYKPDVSQIIFTKSKYLSEETVEEIRYSSQTGTLVYMEPAPSGEGSEALLEELGLKKVRGTVERADGPKILVAVDDGEELKSYAEKIYFTLDESRLDRYPKGSHVEILHDGSFLESAPPIGNLVSINKIE